MHKITALNVRQNMVFRLLSYIYDICVKMYDNIEHYQFEMKTKVVFVAAVVLPHPTRSYDADAIEQWAYVYDVDYT